MDHSDIRGLVTAFHHFFAGLPRSRNGDHLATNASRIACRPRLGERIRRFHGEDARARVVEVSNMTGTPAAHGPFRIDVVDNMTIEWDVPIEISNGVVLRGLR
jgi:hypothetical protein